MKKENNLEEEINSIIENAENFTKTWILDKARNCQKHTYKVLNKNFEDSIFKILGLNDHWGKWEVDHCNGRAGQSSIGDYIKDKSKRDVEKWLDKSIGKLPPLPREAIDDIKKEYKSTIIHFLKDIARERARMVAEQIYKNKIEVILGDKYESE